MSNGINEQLTAAGVAALLNDYFHRFADGNLAYELCKFAIQSPVSQLENHSLSLYLIEMLIIA